MIKIGELSKLTNLSIKTIRFYEEEGLISPVEVDRWTSYRYYDDSSINRLSEIAYLKDLGFSLKEIANLDEETIKEKLKDLNITLNKISKNIKTLSAFQKGGIMKNFVNDEKVIGKWKRLGVVKSEEDFKKGNFNGNKEVFQYFKNLYFLPNGQDYWTLGWTKGKLFVKDNAYKYKLFNNKMLIYIKDKYDGKVDDIVVYEQLDNKSYTKDEIINKDNTDMPFVNDKKLIGLWDVVDCTKNPAKFKTERTDEYMIRRAIVDKDGTFTFIFDNNFANSNLKWTKGYILDQHPKFATASKYDLVEKDGDTFMVMEWKSGDYSFGGVVVCYYVFKKVK